MSSPLKTTFEQAKKLLSIDKKTYSAFEKRLARDHTYYQADGVDEHFCVGVLVINRKEKKMFIGHHKKSDHWMGAGGHMELGESPLDTVIRECKEELNIDVEKATLFDLTHFDDVNRKGCMQHYDFFYLVEHDSREELEFDHNEFHKGGWRSFEEVLNLKLLPKYRDSLLKAFKLIEQNKL